MEKGYFETIYILNYVENYNNANFTNIIVCQNHIKLNKSIRLNKLGSVWERFPWFPCSTNQLTVRQWRIERWLELHRQWHDTIASDWNIELVFALWLHRPVLARSNRAIVEGYKCRR